MKIVHIITSLSQGGAEAMLEKLLIEGRQNHPQINQSVISLRELGVVGPRLQRSDFQVEALHMQGVFGTLKGLTNLVAHLQRLPRDTVVQTWLYHADLMGGLAARMAGLRHIAWNLRMTIARREVGTMTYCIVRACARLSRTIPQWIVHCGPSALSAHVAMGYDAQRSCVIDNGFNTDLFAPDLIPTSALRASLGFEESHFVIGSVARLHPAKDFPTLAKAAAFVCQNFPQARFLWVGADLDTDPELTALLRSLGIEDKIIRPGLRADVVDLLNAMDVFCLSSRSEGFPNVLGEAMSCARPCVTTDAGDAAYLLQMPSWVVPIECPNALADALGRMLDLPQPARKEIGRLNRERILSRFSIKASSDRYIALYGSMLGDASASASPGS
jgi:glycosyltransferase involved in cell wall biosynthesis